MCLPSKGQLHAYVARAALEWFLYYNLLAIVAVCNAKPQDGSVDSPKTIRRDANPFQ